MQEEKNASDAKSDLTALAGSSEQAAGGPSSAALAEHTLGLQGPPTDGGAIDVVDEDPSLSHVPVVVSHLRDNFGVLAPALEPNVYRLGLVNGTIEDMYVEFCSRAVQLVEQMLQIVTMESFILQIEEMLTSILKQELGSDTDQYVRVICDMSDPLYLFVSLLNNGALLELVKSAETYIHRGSRMGGGYRGGRNNMEPRADYRSPYYTDATPVSGGGVGRTMDRQGDGHGGPVYDSARNPGPYSSDPMQRMGTEQQHTGFRTMGHSSMQPPSEYQQQASSAHHYPHQQKHAMQPLPDQRPYSTHMAPPVAPVPSHVPLTGSPSPSSVQPVAQAPAKAAARPFPGHHHHHFHHAGRQPSQPQSLPASAAPPIISPVVQTQPTTRTPAIPAPLSVQQQQRQQSQMSPTPQGGPGPYQVMGAPQPNMVPPRAPLVHQHHHHLVHHHHRSSMVAAAAPAAAVINGDDPMSQSPIPIRDSPPTTASKPTLKIPIHHHHHHHQFNRQVAPAPSLSAQQQQQRAPVSIDADMEGSSGWASSGGVQCAELRAVLQSITTDEDIINGVMSLGKTAKDLLDMEYPSFESFLRDAVPPLVTRQRLRSALKQPPPRANVQLPSSDLRTFMQKNAITTAGCEVRSSGLQVPQPRTKQQAQSPTQASSVSNVASPTEMSHVSSDMDNNNNNNRDIRSESISAGNYRQSHFSDDNNTGNMRGDADDERPLRGGFHRGGLRGGRGGFRDGNRTAECKYYATAKGCQNGNHCRFRHSH